MQNSTKKTICIKLKEKEDIMEKPLSEIRNYTLKLLFVGLRTSMDISIISINFTGSKKDSK